MKKIVLMVMVLAMVLGMGAQAQASETPILYTLNLYDRGMDAYGVQLVYDKDLDITWYTAAHNTYMTWLGAKKWVENLAVTMTDGRTYTGWRLPQTPGTTMGYTNEGEMGHLYYSELGSYRFLGLQNSPFQNLQQRTYWTGSEYAASSSSAWGFDFQNGGQQVFSKYGYSGYALAVRPGDVASVPLPGTVLLFGPALAGMGVLRRKLRRG